jgi:2-keto-4-pentenoate hydratase
MPAKQPSSDPLSLLVWLANESSPALKAGQTNMTGSFVKPEIMEFVATVVIGFGNAGTVRVQVKFERAQS